MSDAISTETLGEPATPNLSIADIQNAIRVIDYAAEQGAFKGWTTIEQVLIVRNKMNEFLKAVAPAETPEQTTTTAA